MRPLPALQYSGMNLHDGEKEVNGYPGLNGEPGFSGMDQCIVSAPIIAIPRVYTGSSISP